MRKKLYLRLNALRFNFSIRRKGHFFEITMHEKYRGFARMIRIGLTIISLVSAFFYFQSVWYAFLFGLAVFLVLEVLNRVLFSYTSMFIHPLPTFQVDSRKWTGCFFGYATHPSVRGHIPVVGWQLSDEAYVKKVHALLLEWSYGELNDEKNNICTSVILMEDNSYIFYCYPNIERKAAVEFFGDVEEQRDKESKSDIHHKIHTMQVIGKRFPISDKSYLSTFVQKYREGASFLFRLAIQDQSGNSVPVENVADFILRNLKIKKRAELTRMDSEYDFVRVLG
ncbi:MAG: hypothetical protein WBB67_03285 [bacterium]